MQSQEERKHGYVKGEVTNQEEREQKHEKSTTDEQQNEIPLMALNHVSRLCKNVKESEDFYTKVLGFVLIERPQAFDFNGAWLFNYGVGIHLVQAKEEDRLPNNTDTLDPMDNHISFQVSPAYRFKILFIPFAVIFGSHYYFVYSLTLWQYLKLGCVLFLIPKIHFRFEDSSLLFDFFIWLLNI